MDIAISEKTRLPPKSNWGLLRVNWRSPKRSITRTLIAAHSHTGVSGDLITVQFWRSERRGILRPYSSGDIYLNRFVLLDFSLCVMGRGAVRGDGACVGDDALPLGERCQVREQPSVRAARNYSCRTCATADGRWPAGLALCRVPEQLRRETKPPCHRQAR
jgi:hypothetical protein